MISVKQMQSEFHPGKAGEHFFCHSRRNNLGWQPEGHHGAAEEIYTLRSDRPGSSLGSTVPSSDASVNLSILTSKIDLIKVFVMFS